MKKKITGKTILKNLDAIVTAVTLSLCVILVNVNVFMRYIANLPFRWSEEVVTGLFVWTVFIGSSYAYRKHAHLGVDIVVNLMNGRTKAIVQNVMSVVELMVLIMLTVISSQYVYNLIYVRGVYKPYVTDMIRMPKWWIGISVPIGFLLSTIYSVIFILRDRLHLIKGKKISEQPDDDTEGESVIEEVIEHEVEGGNF